jgi:hypothetical protein
LLRRRFCYWVYRAVEVGEYDGIHLVSVSVDADVFASVIKKSLELIQTHDARRYLRVKQHIRWIVDAAYHPGAGSSAYHPYLKRCKIDFSDFGWNELNTALFYAKQVVHEATHGVLHSRGFRYTRKTRAQHERICLAEENRFLKRLDHHFPGVHEWLGAEFNASHWHTSWNHGLVRRKYRELRRILGRLAGQRTRT